MENSVQAQKNNSEEFIEWYVDMIENFPNTFVHYLSENALLQWFGRSIKGPDRILYFIKTNMQGSKHIIAMQNTPDDLSTIRVENNVSATVIVKTPSTNNNQTTLNLTPESHVSSTVKVDLDERDDFACGDGPNINNLPLKPKTETVPNGSSSRTNRITNFFEITGAMEFCKPCYKRGVTESKWERPCTLKIGYVGSLANPVDFNIQLIIYGDNMPCKKNLLPEFDKCLLTED